MKKTSHKKTRSAAPTIVVLGAGINGAALARQFVLNNAHVILADTRDIAGGTTAWSTRLIHGGLRYLEYGEFDLVKESLAERNRLVKIAPHLVKPLRFAIPLRQRRGGLLAAAARIVGFESIAKRLGSTQGRGSWAVVSASHCTTSFHETPVGLLTLGIVLAQRVSLVSIKTGFHG